MANRKRLERKSRRNNVPSDGLVTVMNPGGAASEAYRMMRTNLLYALIDSPPKVISVTSPSPREGKSTTCANLAVVLAQAGKNTLLLDCDLRKPVMHKIFQLHNMQGLVNTLVTGQTLERVWHEPVSGLKVVTAGPPPPNPSEILGSMRLAQFLKEVQQEFDYVLLDTPPVKAVSDAAILAAHGDGVLIVVDSQGTGKRALRQSLHMLRAVGARVIGTVMNNVEASSDVYPYEYSAYVREGSG